MTTDITNASIKTVIFSLESYFNTHYHCAIHRKLMYCISTLLSYHFSYIFIQLLQPHDRYFSSHIGQHYNCSCLRYQERPSSILSSILGQSLHFW